MTGEDYKSHILNTICSCRCDVIIFLAFKSSTFPNAYRHTSITNVDMSIFRWNPQITVQIASMLRFGEILVSRALLVFTF